MLSNPPKDRSDYISLNISMDFANLQGLRYVYKGVESKI